MNQHRPLNIWMQYVNDELPPEERERCEAHLDGCDTCLELYMECIGQMAAGLPALPDSDAFAAAVMQRWTEEQPLAPRAEDDLANQPPERKRRIPWTQSPFFHYAVAAAITLLLMSTGVFQSLMGHPEPGRMSHSASDRAEAYVPFSEILLEKTIGILDSIQPKHERGGTR
ncbi:anti-sigma factor family protein [Paenibacillus ehimensis]|uniref:Anti-sigma-W factor RsiW n=1 Tax=Paenibacillus ehimensis TaxID=79264 RepID=A0ABT8VJ80_9BACL|nr:zf-HC2 domain-containing protein [Paenibacillus ehimensis]MDO3680986.1 zf-HC2 domain-containing protein [Paenibacillus ehimensis]